MAAFSERHPPSKRRAVAALMRESDLTMMEVAEKAEVPYGTVSRWNLRHHWRPTLSRRTCVDAPAGWPALRIVALSRVYETPGIEAPDLAQALGFRRQDAETVFRGCGFPARKKSNRPIARNGPALRARLRAHVARQIEAFDALLTVENRNAPGRPRAGSGFDSAKILRDLGGLKKLLDQLDAPAGTGEADAAPEPVRDLVAMRAEIARRCELLSRPGPHGHEAVFDA